LASLVAVRSIPIAGDLIAIWAPLTTLPCASLIVPSIVEIVVWANADKGNRSRRKRTDVRARYFMIPPPQEKVVGTRLRFETKIAALKKKSA
jgi:hypothetical protein